MINKTILLSLLVFCHCAMACAMDRPESSDEPGGWTYVDADIFEATF